MIIALWSNAIGIVVGAAIFALGVRRPVLLAVLRRDFSATAQPDERGAASGTASVFLDLGIAPRAHGSWPRGQAGGILFAFGIAAVVVLGRPRLDLTPSRAGRGGGPRVVLLTMRRSRDLDLPELRPRRRSRLHCSTEPWRETPAANTPERRLAYRGGRSNGQRG